MREPTPDKRCTRCGSFDWKPSPYDPLKCGWHWQCGYCDHIIFINVRSMGPGFA